LCGSLTHSSTTPAALYIQDSLECNNLFRTPPCYIDLSRGRIPELLKRRRLSANALKNFLTHPYNYEFFLHKFFLMKYFQLEYFPIYCTYILAHNYSVSPKAGYRGTAPPYPSQPLNVIHDCMWPDMATSTSRITDFFDHSAHASKTAKRDNSLPNSSEALSPEGSVIKDISEADISEVENTAHARRLHLSSSEVELTDSVHPQSTASYESDSQSCILFCGGS